MLPLLLIQILSLYAFAQGQYLSYLTLGVTPGVTRQYLPQADDDASASIPIPGGFRFGTSTMTSVYVGTNGYFSFGTRQTVYNPSLFSSTSTPNYLVAPFWADINTNVHGSISYEVHTTSAGSSSTALLNRVNTFITNQQNTQFSGTWMLVASWNQVSQLAGSSSDTNTFQGIVITNGTNSYGVFTYQCGDINWGGGATIGYKATGNFYRNHAYSGSSAAFIDCVNSPTTNVVYGLKGIGSDCTSSQFRCTNGQCISSSSRCTGIRTCSDGSDEMNCLSCSGFRCSNYQCVSSSDRCDSARDCTDGSDETGCDSSCSGFRCSNYQCVASSYRCDGTRDCTDGSDESNCLDVFAARQTSIIVGSIFGVLFLIITFWCIAFCICMQVSACPLHNIYYKRTIQNLAEAPPSRSDVTGSYPPPSYPQTAL